MNSMSLKLTSDPETPATPHADTPAPWIPIDEAARRSGRNEGALRRQAGNVWMAQGLAQLRKEGAGKSKWFIRQDADPAFAAVQFPEQLGTDLRAVPAAKRDEALARKKILDDWSTARAGAVKLGFSEMQVTAQFLQRLLLDDGMKISRRTLFNWHKRFRQSGLSGLVDQRGKSDEPRQSDPFLEEIKKLYLSLRKPKITVCYEIACLKAQEAGWTICSPSSVRRFLDEIPPAVVLKYRHGEKAFTNEAEPYHEGDYSTLQSNEIWVGDHHPFDVIVNCGTLADPVYKRPWLTAWQDMRSRKIVGWLIRAEDPNTEAILEALRRGIESHGVPRVTYTDNGKDYDAWVLTGRTKRQRRTFHLQLDGKRLEGIYAALDISQIHATKYHGQSKTIEAWFGKMEPAFGRQWLTFCGKDTADKPEDLAHQIEKGEAPLLADFIAAFEGWLEVGFHQRAHQGDAMDGKTPALVFQENLVTKRTAPKELLDVLLMRTTGPVKVQQNGVRYEGLNYGQYAPELHRLLGQQVKLRADDRDLSSVTVWTLDDQFICVAPANRKLPRNAAREDIRDAQSAKKKLRKTVREYVQARPRLAEDLPDLVIRAAAARNARNTTNDPSLPPPSMQPVRSGLEDQMPALQRALKRLPTAVGAESLSDDSLSITAAARGLESSSESGIEDPFAALVSSSHHMRLSEE